MMMRMMMKMVVVMVVGGSDNDDDDDDDDESIHTLLLTDEEVYPLVSGWVLGMTGVLGFTQVTSEVGAPMAVSAMEAAEAVAVTITEDGKEDEHNEDEDDDGDAKNCCGILLAGGRASTVDAVPPAHIPAAAETPFVLGVLSGAFPPQSSKESM